MNPNRSENHPQGPPEASRKPLAGQDSISLAPEMASGGALEAKKTIGAAKGGQDNLETEKLIEFSALCLKSKTKSLIVSILIGFISSFLFSFQRFTYMGISTMAKKPANTVAIGIVIVKKL